MSDCGENRHTCTSQSNSSYLSWHHSTDSGTALLIYSCRKSGLCYSSFKPTTSKFLLCSLKIQEINNAWHCTREDCPHLLLSQCPREHLPWPIYLQRAPKHTDHQHGDGEIVREHIPPGLQHSERWLLLRELAKLGHGNHPPGKEQGQRSASCSQHPPVYARQQESYSKRFDAIHSGHERPGMWHKVPSCLPWGPLDTHLTRDARAATQHHHAPCMQGHQRALHWLPPHLTGRHSLLNAASSVRTSLDLKGLAKAVIRCSDFTGLFSYHVSFASVVFTVVSGMLLNICVHTHYSFKPTMFWVQVAKVLQLTRTTGSMGRSRALSSPQMSRLTSSPPRRNQLPHEHVHTDTDL